MKTLQQIIYYSTASVKFSESDLMKLLVATRKRNHQKGITGLLIYSDGNFMGVLEGPKIEVEKLIETIRSDKRHRGFTTAWSKPKTKRDFSEYLLVYKNCNQELSDKYPQLHKMVDDPDLGLSQISNASTEVQVLIKTFLKTTLGYRF